mmetsp:Transcript_65202/g.142903  ORF Transcript_65202/g.142903 Transcript_65202/m.142903 type:complete len:243 (-) Transcript_65202:584-1312(-)
MEGCQMEQTYTVRIDFAWICVRFQQTFHQIGRTRLDRSLERGAGTLPAVWRCSFLQGDLDCLHCLAPLLSVRPQQRLRCSEEIDVIRLHHCRSLCIQRLETGRPWEFCERTPKRTSHRAHLRFQFFEFTPQGLDLQLNLSFQISDFCGLPNALRKVIFSTSNRCVLWLLLFQLRFHALVLAFPPLFVCPGRLHVLFGSLQFFLLCCYLFFQLSNLLLSLFFIHGRKLLPLLEVAILGFELFF